MPRVLNLDTGLEHDVPEGHWSLRSSRYEPVIPLDPDEPQAAPAKPKRKPVKRK